MEADLFDRKRAYTIAELVELGPFGRSKLYELIGEGKLTARKVGKKVFVLAEDYENLLTEAPKASITPPRRS